MRQLSSSIVLVTSLILVPVAAHAEESMQGQKAHGMVNCPSTVPGAKTAVSDTKQGVEVVVTAEGKNAVRQIKARAQTQTDKRKSEGSVTHTGEGTGAGAAGYCPIVHVGTTVAVKDVKDGVKITVTAVDKKNVAEVQKITKDRVSALEKRAGS